jgi:hypothetical protein
MSPGFYLTVIPVIVAILDSIGYWGGAKPFFEAFTATTQYSLFGIPFCGYSFLGIVVYLFPVMLFLPSEKLFIIWDMFLFAVIYLLSLSVSISVYAFIPLPLLLLLDFFLVTSPYWLIASKKIPTGIKSSLAWVIFLCVGHLSDYLALFLFNEVTLISDLILEPLLVLVFSTLIYGIIHIIERSEKHA